MSAAGVLRTLLETTLASSAAVLAVMVLRGVLRAGFGARIAYAAWSLVPAALVAVLLPAAGEGPTSAPALAFVAEASPWAFASEEGSTTNPAAWLLAGWLVGAVATGLWFAARQRGFWRALGHLRLRDDGMYQAETVAGLPAAVGVWRPRIIVPMDFDVRYDEEERVLLREHEHQHLVRGDLRFNATVVLLRCLFWFNPLLHYAARHFRQDQELSCDQRVLARHPASRRTYGEAMLKTQLATQPWPLGCHWGFCHPLKERIIMLKQPLPSFSRWLSGCVCVLALTLTGGYAAWAAQPNDAVAAHLSAGRILVTAVLRINDDEPTTTTFVTMPGQSLVIDGSANGHDWAIEGTVARGVGNQPDVLMFHSTIKRDGKVVATPRIGMLSGQPGMIRMGADPHAGGENDRIELHITLTAAGAGT
ncbi:energy transducer TonB [Pyxidicoccus fallax]|uniref:Energy transducer TonB n=1 Tax=Pyxidicoccus fallax TaxID=394095 RepID=A0A848LD86_9BACT|nr:M56 family metallopeptidase [Pyxidicoccus fallax]NMO14221.1 energy transducer TonB [Pyxidicoccus fallax]NPC80387.1 energy transducer TonB [Pyxidicoccus fallax]